MFIEIDQQQEGIYPFDKGQILVEVGGETYQISCISEEVTSQDQDRKFMGQIGPEFFLTPGVVGKISKTIDLKKEPGKDYLWRSDCAYHIGGKIVKYEFGVFVSINGKYYGLLTIKDPEKTISIRMISISSETN